MFTAVQRYECTWPAPIAEAIGILFGLAQAVDCSMENVEIESDCLVVVNLLKRKEIPRTDLGKVVEDILLLASQLSSVIWSHTPKTSNTLAHHLAKSIVVLHNCFWWHSYPAEVVPYLSLVPS